MEALHDIVRAGKARYIGASNLAAWQFAKAQRIAERNRWTEFVSLQTHYNLLHREDEREHLPQCRDQGVAVLPWSPLARGLLTGTRTRAGERRSLRAETDGVQDRLYGRDEDFDVVDAVVEVAAGRGVPPAQIALAWLLQQPAVTAPIIGATKLEHIADAVAATGLRLESEELSALTAPYRPHTA
jgi:aryl-alcohol dehydrogenase-like predicted oxidoreductase